MWLHYVGFLSWASDRGFLLTRSCNICNLPLLQVRARVWPVLLGVDIQEFDERAYKIWQRQPHRDSSVVKCDVERSLWSYTEGESNQWLVGLASSSPLASSTSSYIRPVRKRLAIRTTWQSG